jgi:hypothetical protein
MRLPTFVGVWTTNFQAPAVSLSGLLESHVHELPDCFRPRWKTVVSLSPGVHLGQLIRLEPDANQRARLGRSFAGFRVITS